MIKSLNKYCKNSEIFVLCMDNKTYEILEIFGIENVNCIRLNQIENKDLLNAKSTRSIAEYCWTLASFFTLYIIEKYKNIELITYLDADIMFYSNLNPIFEEIGDSSIAIIEHRFAEPFKSLEVNGRFCVEWNTFRRDEEGMKCLKKWTNQCLEWCYYKLEDGKMGDQKFLDEWPKLYKSCHIINETGAGIAPWNYSKYNISQKGNMIKINNENLIFYHFHQFKILENNNFYRLGEIYTSLKKEPNIVYEIYEKNLLGVLNDIRKIDKNFKKGIYPNPNLFKEKLKIILPRFLKNLYRKFI